MSVRCDECSDTEAVKTLRKKTCLKCNGGDGVLVCCNAGCPVVIHRQCMPCVASFDDGGNYYCPYCAYKRSLGELRKAKESTSLAKKSLVRFLDTMAVKSSKMERPERSEFTFQNDILQDDLGMKLGDPKKSDEIRSEGVIRIIPLKNDHVVMNDNVMPSKLDSDNLKTKRQKTAVSLEGHCNEGVQRKQTRKETHKTTVCSTRNDFMETCEDTDKINAATTLNECPSSERLKLNSEKGDQFAEIQKDQCDDVCHKRKHDASVIHKESGKFSGECQGSEDTEQIYNEKVEEKEQQLAECSSNLRRKDGLSVTMDGNVGGIAKKVYKDYKQTGHQERTKLNTEAARKEAEEINDRVCEDEYLKSHMTVNKNDADQTSNTRDLHCKKADDEENTGGASHEKSYNEDKIKSYGEKHHTGYELRARSQIPAHSEMGNQPNKSSSSYESEFEEYEEARVKTRRKVHSVQQSHGTPVFVGRRKKLPWTIVEFQILKEGVDKFSSTTKKNMPWMKILEFGCHIFDGTRTPDDLKDKWRRMLGTLDANA